jgi:hypothetical protein
VPISASNENDALLALVDGKWVVLCVPYPLSFYAKGLDGRVDDASAGWKGRGVWMTSSDRVRASRKAARARSRSLLISNSAPGRSPIDGAPPGRLGRVELRFARKRKAEIDPTEPLPAGIANGRYGA